MHKDVIGNAGFEAFAEIALIIFVTVFMLVMIRALWMNTDKAQHMEKLPLHDGERLESTQESTT